MLFISDKSMGVGKRISSNFYSAMGRGGGQTGTNKLSSNILQIIVKARFYGFLVDLAKI